MLILFAYYLIRYSFYCRTLSASTSAFDLFYFLVFANLDPVESLYTWPFVKGFISPITYIGASLAEGYGAGSFGWYMVKRYIVSLKSFYTLEDLDKLLLVLLLWVEV